MWTRAIYVHIHVIAHNVYCTKLNIVIVFILTYRINSYFDSILTLHCVCVCVDVFRFCSLFIHFEIPS